MAHKKIVIRNEQGIDVEAIAPVIVSASRATDIPAFYADWFFNRLDKGYASWRNPFNGKDSYVSFANTHFVVFWSKNPKPLIPYLPIMQEKGYWQIVEVIKAKGFNFIEPATCALICGKDPRISGRQQTMLEEEGIDYINVFNLLR